MGFEGATTKEQYDGLVAPTIEKFWNGRPLPFPVLINGKGIQVQIGFIGLLLAEQRISTRDAISGLWVLKDEPGTTQEQQSQIYFLDDGYDLAIAGTYGTMPDVERELQELVLPYTNRLAEHFPHLVPSLKRGAPGGGSGET